MLMGLRRLRMLGVVVVVLLVEVARQGVEVALPAGEMEMETLVVEQVEVQAVIAEAVEVMRGEVALLVVGLLLEELVADPLEEAAAAVVVTHRGEQAVEVHRVLGV